MTRAFRPAPGSSTEMSAGKPCISVYIITLNEANAIGCAIESVRWADEIVVLDSGSVDDTCVIARKLGARVETWQFEGFAAQKNAAMNLCEGEWLLNIDADEEVTSELERSIRKTVGENRKEPGAYEVNRRTWYLGRWMRHCGWYPQYRTRLCRAGEASWSGGSIHEYLESGSRPGRLDGDLLHRPYDNLSDHLKKIGKYADIWAREHTENGGRAGWIDLLFRPLARFLKMYVLKAGFLDGMPGLVASAMGSVYAFMKYARLYEIAGSTDENV